VASINGKKLHTLKDFHSVISKLEGIVVITDVANPTRIHLPSCTRLKEDYFFEKMVENNGKYGLYLWYESIELAKQSHLDTVNCKFCNT
jgi:hypothetical protein